MSTNYYNSYEQDRKRRLALWEQAPRQCPYCETPINTDIPVYGNDKPRHHCGSNKCRKAASRASIAERKRQARTDARQRVLVYCETWLDQEQKRAMLEMCDALMAYNYDEGHEVAEQVVQVVEAKRCKHDRIAELERNAVAWQRRAEASERQSKERIEELEAELRLFNSLNNTIHSIATQQLQLQPDPQEQPIMPQKLETTDDPDRARTLAVLAGVGISPYNGDDDTEQGDTDEDEE